MMVTAVASSPDTRKFSWDQISELLPVAAGPSSSVEVLLVIVSPCEAESGKCEFMFPESESMFCNQLKT